MSSFIAFVVTAAILQLLIFILLAIFANYDSSINPRNTGAGNATKKDEALEMIYPYFQDVQGMIFLGFGFLMTFLKKYGYGSVGLNFFLSVFCIEWALLINGFFHMYNGQIHFSAGSLIGAEFATATILISFGVVLGKTSPLQLLLIGLVEVPIFVANEYVGRNILKVSDVGDSIFVHTFGAYFGLSMSRVLYRRGMGSSRNEGSNYHSDIFAMIGTLVLWIFWPSFNAGGLEGDRRHRAVVNTFLALLASSMVTFILSSALERGRINMVHIANATLSGGVAIGAAADLAVRPWGACLVGMLAGTISTLGYKYLTPRLNNKGFHDTCGVNNLHGMPGILAGVVVAVASAFVDKEEYGSGVEKIFEARKYRSAGTQAGFQFLALAMTVGVAALTGALTGLLLRCNFLRMQSKDDSDHYFNDSLFWEVPEDFSSKGHHYDSPEEQFKMEETSN